MRSQGSGQGTLRALLLALATVAGCHRPSLLGFDGWLIFSAPDSPVALKQPDAGLVAIEFGQVPVGATATLTVSYASVGGGIGLGDVTPVGDAGDFSLSSPSAAHFEASFTPSQGGRRTGVLQMTEGSLAVPKVTFQLTGEGIIGALVVAPNPIDFDGAHVGDTISQTFTVSNAAAIPASLVFSAIQGMDLSAFSISGSGQGPLAPGASQTFSASFLAQLGYQTAFFDVAGWSGQVPERVGLNGEGVYGYLTISPSVEFGEVPLGLTATQSAVVSNVSASQTFHLVAPGPSLNAAGAGFSLGPTKLSLPTSIPPGGSAAVAITFGPIIAGAFVAELVVESDDPNARQLNAYLDGTGVTQFACAPASLDFGPVPVGRSGALTTLCTNQSGVPFEIAQGALRTSSPDFAASLLLPDGGPAGPDGDLRLGLGESADISVVFRPTHAGDFVAGLAVTDGGPDTFGATIPMRGTGVTPVPCDLQVTPPQLDFGEVPAGSQELTQLELANNGGTLCLIDSVALDPASDPAFGLPGGPQGYALLSYPGNPINPAGLPTSLRLLVSYSPTQSEPLASGTIDVTTANAIPAEDLVPVSGSSQQACLRIQPPLHDFGTLLFIDQQVCFSAETSFTIRNTCASSVSVTGLAIGSGVDQVPPFAPQSSLQLPLSLAPSASAQFQASFIPTTTGPKVGAISVTSNEPGLAPYLVSLEGDAELSVPRTDDFTMSAPTKPLDILWILDADDDADEEGAVAQFVPSLVGAMSQAGIDFRMAVTTTDTCDADRSDQGALEPCGHCLLWGDAGGPEFVTSQTPNPGAELVRLFDIPALQALPAFGICALDNGDEHFFDSIALALSTDQLAGHNAGFLRENSDLAVILINGDAEDDGAAAGLNVSSVIAPGIYLTSLAQVIALLGQVKPSSKASVFYVASGEAVLGASQKIGKLVKATGGLEIDTTEPDATWEAEFTGLFQYFQKLGFFTLTQVPVDPSDIRVSVNGIATDAWSYDAAQNAVVLEPWVLPPPGSQISITYSVVGCPFQFPL